MNNCCLATALLGRRADPLGNQFSTMWPFGKCHTTMCRHSVCHVHVLFYSCDRDTTDRPIYWAPDIICQFCWYAQCQHCLQHVFI